jgi:adenosylhomocysteinase
MNSSYSITDISLAPEGRRKIEWVSQRMPVLNKLHDRFQADGVFKGSTVAVSIHLEAKTAYLCLILKRLGADVWATGSNPFSTKDDVCAALAEEGVHVFAHHGVSESDHHNELQSLLSARPQAVLDDGADICTAIHRSPEYGDRLKGISEETTTGVLRLRTIESAGRLRFAAVTVNNAKSKHMFDNRYGTGQSTWTAITHLSNMTVGGKKVVIIGYGWVGLGVATIARGMGAHVIVCEIDPWKALEAHMDGYEVMPIDDAARVGQIFVTATGLDRILRMEHLGLMQSGAIIGNAGHSDIEIDVPALMASAVSTKEARENVFEYVLPDGRKINLLANGRIVNIAGGMGHPAEIMDMSFSLQLASLHYLLRTPQMKPGIYELPGSIDELVVREKLATEGLCIDSSR